MVPHQAALRPTGRRQEVGDLGVLDGDRGVGGCACHVRPEAVVSRAVTVAMKLYTVDDDRPWRCRSVRGQGPGLADSVGGVLDVGELLS